MQRAMAEDLSPPLRADPGNRTEFETLLTPLLNAAYGTALRVTCDRSSAEDLVQEAALLACRAFSSFERGTNFKAWFFRILTNAFYAGDRREKHHRTEISMDDAAPLYLYARTHEIGLHSHDDPANQLMDRLDSEHVAEALDGLPTEYRIVATLYFIEDLSYHQIAGVVSCPVGTVRSRLHRARRMLQKRLWWVAQERGIVRALTEPPTQAAAS